ncbi:cucumopine synthase [Aspergillus alliaceus]|uniref:cucumopine synthase n=1 Tax=Petromyces alliaceus TaxID=209559 RepID=UPI0012A59C1F|nr:cucumopine synthase [Aspergillus alliaceus]KAB8236919.1 cucumopine synthase [Aspergillus alliaceus]
MIKVKWPQINTTVSAVMDSEANPRLVNLLCKHLPYRSLQDHALVSGDHLYHLVPAEELIYTHTDHKVPNRVTEPDGTVFLSGLRHLAIKYGPRTEYLPAAPCGRDADMSEPTENLPLISEGAGVTAPVKRLVQEINDETEKFWSGVSADLSIVHRGMTPSRAGSKGSYFATMVFINEEIRPLGYNLLNNILSVATTQPRFNLEHHITLYRVFAFTPAEFVGYVGGKHLHSTYRKIDDLINSSIQDNRVRDTAREDFLALISAFARYVNLLNAQNLHLFP